MPVVKISLHSPDILSSISREKAAGSSLNFVLQFFSRHSSAFRTVSGFSSLVSAARERICLAWVISVSGFVATVVDRNFAEEDGLGRDGMLACGRTVNATAHWVNARIAMDRFMVVSLSDTIVPSTDPVESEMD